MRLGLEIHTDPLGVPLLWGNGEKVASEVQVTYPVPVTIQMLFSVIHGGEAKIMVGYNWLSKHNPSIDWLTGELTWKQENCSAECILSQHVDVNNIEILKDKRVIGMMDVPIMSVDDGQLLEVKDTSTKSFIVVCEPSEIGGTTDAPWELERGTSPGPFILSESCVSVATEISEALDIDKLSSSAL